MNEEDGSTYLRLAPDEVLQIATYGHQPAEQEVEVEGPFDERKDKKIKRSAHLIPPIGTEMEVLVGGHGQM